MKFYITCTCCHEEKRHDFGSGKKAEQNFEYWNGRGDWVCDDCLRTQKEAAYEAKVSAEREDKLARGWKEITVHYSVYKNEYENLVTENGEKVVKGEYHADTKEIDLLVPPTDEEETEEEIAEEVTEEAPKSAHWNSIEVNECFVGKTHGNATLIRVPSRSDYEGYSFWHPTKCVKQMPMGDYRLSYTDDWNFHLTANGGALEANLNAEEFEEAIDARDWWKYEEPSRYYQPIKLDAVETDAIEELIDND